MTVTEADLGAHVAAHAGVSQDRAARAIRAVLSGIGAYLDAPHRELVADELPPALAGAVRAGDRVAVPLDERVLDPGTTAAQARELIASVCRVLVEELSREAVRAVRAEAPPELAALLVPGGAEAPPRPAGSSRRETLAAGRPGSHHPVSEQRPRAQPDSVAAANPHATTKLSSAAGSAQEGRRDTLASGQPGSEQPISRTHR
jgi:uncharacterized protein (DUF2267 family)